MKRLALAFLLILGLGAAVWLSCGGDDDDDDESAGDDAGDDDDDDDDDTYNGECDDQYNDLTGCLNIAGNDWQEALDCYVEYLDEYLDCLDANGYGDAPWVSCLSGCHDALIACLDAGGDELDCYEAFVDCWDACPDIP